MTRPRLIGGLGVAVGLLAASPAMADPCEGPLPRQVGAEFIGQVRYIGDGDSLCVGSNHDPSTWIEVRLADFNAPELHATGGLEAKALLHRVSFGRTVACSAERGRSGRVISYDRVIARCRLGGIAIGDLMRQGGGVEGGN